MGAKSKNPNWFFELTQEQQVEYCMKLKGTRPSIYCTGKGVPRPNPSKKTALEHDYYDLNGKYAFAKKSEIKNIGEDIEGAARHVRNKGRVITIDGIIEENKGESVSRNQLLSTLDFEKDLTEGNAHIVFAMHRWLSLYPKECNEKDRKKYLTGFKALSEKAAELIKTESDTTRALVAMRNATDELMVQFRADDPYNDLSNRYWRMKISALRGKNSITNQLIKATEEEIREGRGLKGLRARVSGAMKGKKPLVKGKSVQRDKFREDSLYKNDRYEISNQTFKDHRDAEKYLGSLARGIQFGNSLPTKQRAEHLVACAQSIKDLSQITGLSESSIFQNGKLGIAFAARGKKGAAHYESKTKALNLTRDHGYGALAHEIAHFLDHSYGEKVVGNNMKKGHYLSSYSSYYSKHADTEKKKAIASAMHDVYGHIETMCRRMRNDPGMTDIIRSKSQYKYYFSSTECFARMFESYVDRKAKSKGVKNSYLIQKPNHPAWPTEEETDGFMGAFDNLMKEISED
nr:hypothetical protein BdHM001_35890 [Bdellovibrio sp. HM001]